DVLDLLNGLGIQLGRVAADLQQRQYQRGELVAHGNAGEGEADVGTWAIERERRTTGVATIGLQGDFVGQADDVLEQAQQLLGFVAVIKGRDDLERQDDLFQVGLQLGLQVSVQHGE